MDISLAVKAIEKIAQAVCPTCGQPRPQGSTTAPNMRTNTAPAQTAYNAPRTGRRPVRSVGFSVPVSSAATVQDPEYKRLSEMATNNKWTLKDGIWESPSKKTYTQDQVLQALTARRRSGTPDGGALTLRRNNYDCAEFNALRKKNPKRFVERSAGGRNVVYDTEARGGTYYFGNSAACPRDMTFVNKKQNWWRDIPSYY